jgi:hypothetical protein
MVDDTFEDADFTVRNSVRKEREFVLHREAGDVSVGD